jgi:flagellar hook-length control protein FliK
MPSSEGDNGEQPLGDRHHRASSEARANADAKVGAQPRRPMDMGIPNAQSAGDPNQPEPEAGIRARGHVDAVSSSQLDSEIPAGAAPRGPEIALQTSGLTAHASQTAVVHVTAAVANAANTFGPTTAPHPIAAPVPLASLAVEIAAAGQAGKQRFEIRLDPPELGRIDVRLELDRDGNVTTRITVERADTLDLLRRDAGQLERALQQAGLKTSDNALEFSLRQQSFARDEHAAASTARLVVSDDDPASPETARHGYSRPLGLGGGLDIRV